MKRLLVCSTLLGAMFPALLAGCSEGANGSLLGGGATAPAMATDPDSLAAGPTNTQHHFQTIIGADNGITDPNVVQAQTNAIGSPEAAARLHATQKIQYIALGKMLSDFGVDLTATADGSAGSLYANGGSALGMPIYANRVPEASFPSTSSLAKQFDIYTAAAPEIAAGIANSKRCPGVALFDSVSGNFTSDGVSCLLGKPARPEHVALANQIMTEATTPALGQAIAIATLLSAAHTSE